MAFSVGIGLTNESACTHHVELSLDFPTEAEHDRFRGDA